MRYRLGADITASSGPKMGTGAVPNNDGTANANPTRTGALNFVHPTTAFLIMLIIAEYMIFLFLRHAFRNAHGG